ncbi:MAG TPA: hypothetical protein VK186_05420, partial [Candidatus Deferrimicrobium sp.]|nr:hypothetical protein [Candidatus Deferrimicrobium sp.]
HPAHPFILHIPVQTSKKTEQAGWNPQACISREAEERFVRRLVDRVNSKSDRNALFTEAES